MELSQYGELFLSESREHVSAINHLLLALEQDAGSREVVEGVFRAVHTIKGMSATMGYRVVADLAHEMENLLDRVRTGHVGADGTVVDLLFAAADALERAIETAVDENDVEVDLSSLLADLRAAAESGAPGGAQSLHSGASPAPAPAPARGGDAHPDDADGELIPGMLAVRLRVSPDSMLPGVRAFMAVKRARDFGELSGMEPPEGELQTADFTGTLRFHLRTSHDAEEVRAALASVGEIDQAEVAPARERRAAQAQTRDAEPAGRRAADEGAEGGGAAAPAEGSASRARNIRVDLRRLDALMNQVGELVIVRDRLRRLAAGSEPELAESVDQASRLVGELQDEIMRVRMA
ncbi:MAG TPA: Hpt domain-containing protein, partial [Longimicrobiaceae bacterium]|nr:Hpt domain-containing protein [Longimicrobiaceae bacterium]